MRKTSKPIIIALAVVVGISLSSCGSAEQSALDAVTVSGEFGESPEITFDAPLEVTESTHTTVTSGDGEVVEEGESVDVHMTALSASTGEVNSETEYTEGGLVPFPADPEMLMPALADSLIGETLGSRVLTVVSAEDAAPPSTGQGQPQAEPDAIVAVIDLVRKTQLTADGEPQEPEAGFPTVELDEDGAPTVTMPDDAPPEDLQIGVLKKGDGDEVAAGDVVRVQYQGVVWDSGEIFDGSWARGMPAQFGTDQVIPGFGKAMVGQTVGSQVIAVIPPGDDNYAEGNVPPSAAFTHEDTLVFVIDILGTSSS